MEEFLDESVFQIIENEDRGRHVIATVDIEPGHLLMHAMGIHFNTEIYNSAQFLEYITLLMTNEETQGAVSEVAKSFQNLCPRQEPNPSNQGEGPYEWVEDADLYCAKLDQNTFDQGIFPAASSFNHSCQPNAAGFCLSKEDGLALFEIRTTRAVASNEELCISYLGLQQLVLPADQRRTILLRSHNFECSCKRCLDEFSNGINETTCMNVLEGQCPHCGGDLATMQDTYICTSCNASVEECEQADKVLTQAFRLAQTLPIRSSFTEVLSLYNKKLEGIGPLHWIRFPFWTRIHALVLEFNDASGKIGASFLLHAAFVEAMVFEEEARVSECILGSLDITTITILEQALDAWIRVRTLCKESAKELGAESKQVEDTNGGFPLHVHISDAEEHAAQAARRLTQASVNARKSSNWTIL